MFLTKRTQNWIPIEKTNSWKCFKGFNIDRLLILEHVWKDEMGALSEHCVLLGVEKNAIVIKTDSAVVANEITLKSRITIKSLNKHYRTPWIKYLKIANKF
jgi:Dna[CI] antecedent, DciA